jgi:hypothetical protein
MQGKEKAPSPQPGKGLQGGMPGTTPCSFSGTLKPETVNGNLSLL